MLQSWVHEQPQPAARPQQMNQKSISDTLTKRVGINPGRINDMIELAFDEPEEWDEMI